MSALHRALRRKQDLLQKLKEQYMLEDHSRPHTWGGTHRYYPQPPPRLSPMGPIHVHQPGSALPTVPPPPPQVQDLPRPPHIIQQTLPQQPATIIQQLPQQQPLITQISPPLPYPTSRPGSIKEDMVELMLMQNAQMHQIIMHNMMLKAMPPMALSPPGGSYPSYLGFVIYKTPRGSSVHHHHHYGSSPAAPQLPPLTYPVWAPGITSFPDGHSGGQLPTMHHVTVPITLPPLNAKVNHL
uniref:Zgc:112416 n=1 Tax=Sphaeramia orbicularis TaxID=375764 RepID=A0A673B8N1_9TELE